MWFVINNDNQFAGSGYKVDKCALCKYEIRESQSLDGGVYTLNPKTFRMSWLCWYCLEEEMLQLRNSPAKKAGFDSRYDEYLHFDIGG